MVCKNLRLDKVRAVIEEFARQRVLTSGFFMVGFPTETEAEMRMTIDFALKSSLHNALFFVVSPFEGTELYEQVCQQAVEPHFDVKTGLLAAEGQPERNPGCALQLATLQGLSPFFRGSAAALAHLARPSSQESADLRWLGGDPPRHIAPPRLGHLPDPLCETNPGPAFHSGGQAIWIGELAGHYIQRTRLRRAGIQSIPDSRF